jgi:fibronectin-binding autotransporter adhesin
MKLKLIAATLTLAALLPAALHAASHTWSGAVNGYFSNAGNWSAGGVPTLAETNSLVFPVGATRFTITNDIGALKLTSINLSGSGYVLRGASTLTFVGNLIDIQAGGATNTIESPIHFNSVGAVAVGPDDALALAGAVSGTNGFVKYGYGDLCFRGAASNPLSGKLQAAYGALHFQKTGGATPYNGNQIEIGVMDTANLAYLELHASDCIPDGATLTFAPSGVLRMNGFSEVVGAVSMHGGLINGTAGGLLRLGDTLTLTPRVAGTNGLGQAIFESPTLWGEIQFGGASATIHVTTNIAKIEALISEYSTPSPIHKTGPGTLTLAAANTFAGQLNVLEGKVFAEESTSLGTTAGGTVVANGASLELPTGVTFSEPLVLHGAGVNGAGALQLDVGGNTTASGLITVSNLTRVFVPAAQQLQLSGVIGGPGGLEKTGPGDLLLAGVSANTFSGASFVNGGRMLLGKTANTKAIASVTVTNGTQLHFNANEQMDNAGVLSIYSGGSVNLSNRNETIGGLNIGRGTTLDTGTGLLTLLGDVEAGTPYSTTSGSVTIRGFLSLGGGNRHFHAPDASFRFDCVVSDGAGVGGLRLSGNGGSLGFGNFHFIQTNTFNGPVTADYAGLLAHNPRAFGTTNGGVFGTNNCEVILFQTNLVITGETLTSEKLVILYSTGSNAWNGPVLLPQTNSILKFNPWTVGATNTLAVNGPISGLGGLVVGDNTYFAPGMTVRLTQSNSYAGHTEVFVGTLAIQHTNSLGGTSDGTTVFGNGRLRLELSNGATMAGESLTLFGSGGDAESPGHLTMAGPVSNNWNGPLIIQGSPSRISVPNMDGTLKINTVITGGYGLAKTGPGTLILAGQGTNQIVYLIAEFGPVRLAQTGGFAVAEGVFGGEVGVAGEGFKTFEGTAYYMPASVHLDQPGQLPPSTSLNLVGPYGGFFLNDQNLTIQDLSGAGGIYMDHGTLTWSNSAWWHVSTFAGPIVCEIPGTTNLIKKGDGTLQLHGPSTTWESGGFWYLYDSIALQGRVLVEGGELSVSNGIIGSLLVNAFTVATTRSAPTQGADPSYMNGLRIGSLTGSGNLNLINGAQVYLGTDNANSTFDGPISGTSPARLIKTGAGTVTLTAPGTSFTGDTLVEEGTLLVNGTLNGPVQVMKGPESASATLGGAGTVGNVTLSGLGARIAPGPTTNTPSYGKLTVGSLTMNAGSALLSEINGTNAGVNLDQIDAAGTVSLNGGFADFLGFGLGAVSNQYAVVKSAFPVSGTFLNNPEGDYVYPSAGRIMQITYLTAGGKEIILIEQAGAPPSNINITGITMQPGGHMKLTGTGTIGATYFIEGNTNLATTNWVTLGSVTGDWNGGINFTDTNAPSFPQRFYRFRLQ